MKSQTCSCGSGNCASANEVRVRLKSGIPLGGIGAGTVELRDDGLFHDWQIFGNWRHEEMHLSFDDAFFTFRARPENGEPGKWALSTEPRAGLQPASEISYSGRFPFAHLSYRLPDSPCAVKLTAFSPFIPHDSKNSGIPAAVFEFEIQNTTNERCEVSVALHLRNPAGVLAGLESAYRPASGSGWSGVEITCENVTESARENGSVIVAALSGEVQVDSDFISSTVALQPGETATLRLLLAWHFPHFIDAEGLDIGRMYSHWFDSASAVADYVTVNLESLAARTRCFCEVFYRSSLPEWLVDAVNAQFTTLFKSSWWTHDGTFAIWEGLGCCGTQTADVAYYGSFGLLALFPELAKQAMRLSARFQNPSGRIPHFFPGTFQYPDAYHMIDLMPKFALMAWRDYLWTGDRAYLDEMWPHVIAAMEHNRALDRNGDFLPDNCGIDQTYDGWEFEGASIYVGLINTVACKATAHMARMQGEATVADQYDRLAAIGAASLERLLWNGEYYDLFFDIGTGHRDSCCMADQMNGMWYARMLELGEFLADDRVKSALMSVLRYNQEGDCIRNGAYPRGGEPETGGQWSAVWSGTEYMLASILIYEGMVEEGLKVAKAVYVRHAADGRTWNHMECGDHYYRAMSVLTILYAAQGFRYCAPDARLVIDPALERKRHVSPLITPLGWGELIFEAGKRLSIEMMSGELELLQIEVGLGFAGIAASLDGRDLDVECAPCPRGLAVRFADNLIMKEGSVLEIKEVVE